MYCNIILEGFLPIICAFGMFIITVAALISAATSDTTTQKGTLEITQTFEGLKDGVIPPEFVLGLFSLEDKSKKHSDLDYDHLLPKGTRYVFHSYETGQFQLSENCGENVRLEHVWNENGHICGFKWTITDLPYDSYYIEAAVGKTPTGCVPGYHRRGLKINNEEPQLDLKPIWVSIDTNGRKTLSLTEVYEPNRVVTREEKVVRAEADRAYWTLNKQHNTNKWKTYCENLRY